MTIRAGKYSFAHAVYDDEGDVLYLAIDKPQVAVSDLMPNNTVLRFDQKTGELCGMTILNPRLRLERDGLVIVTLPDGSQVALEGVESAIKQPA